MTDINLRATYVGTATLELEIHRVRLRMERLERIAAAAREAQQWVCGHDFHADAIRQIRRELAALDAADA